MLHVHRFTGEKFQVRLPRSEQSDVGFGWQLKKQKEGCKRRKGAISNARGMLRSFLSVSEVPLRVCLARASEHTPSLNIQSRSLDALSQFRKVTFTRPCELRYCFKAWIYYEVLLPLAPSRVVSPVHLFLYLSRSLRKVSYYTSKCTPSNPNSSSRKRDSDKMKV